MIFENRDSEKLDRLIDLNSELVSEMAKLNNTTLAMYKQHDKMVEFLGKTIDNSRPNVVVESQKGITHRYVMMGLILISLLAVISHFDVKSIEMLGKKIEIIKGEDD